MPYTEHEPKCFTTVAGRPILDWIIEAFSANGISDIIFIGGYHLERVKAKFPSLRFYNNDRWAENNILASLMYAKPEMEEPFLCCYSDTLIQPALVSSVLAPADDIVVSVDAAWKDRYAGRTQHPTTDAEKVTAANGLLTRIHRDIPEKEAHGEYTGLTKFSRAGARMLVDSYQMAHAMYAGKPYREASVFEKAYFIHLLQEMLERGIHIAHADYHGGYIEIDTTQDVAYAQDHWQKVSPTLPCSSQLL